MATYGAATDMTTLLRQMQVAARGDSTGTLKTLQRAEIRIPPLDWDANIATLFFFPSESPPEALGNIGGAFSPKKIVHEVAIWAAMYVDVHDENQRVLELTTLVGETVEFFDGNNMGLTGLQENVPASCDVVAGGYNVALAGDDHGKLRMLAELRYRAETIPFTRGGL